MTPEYKSKHPLTTHEDPQQQVIGEMQLTQALIFLSTPKKSEQIISSIDEALEMGRDEYAWAVIDGLLRGSNDYSEFYNKIRAIAEKAKGKA